MPDAYTAPLKIQMQNKQTENHCRCVLVLCLCALLLFSTVSQLAVAQRPASGSRNLRLGLAKLVVLISIDQFRYDYLERFGGIFGPSGIKRLLREGASWTNSNFDHVPTYTAPGHSTMMTGAWPAETGIIANEWPDRETGKHVTSVSDTDAKLLGGGPSETASSPRRLMASTIGDELRLRSNGRSKVVGVSIKDRAAILPSGRHANAAYWFSSQTGNMVSSDYYFNQLPQWVQRFNASRPADKYFNAKWERSLPESEYLKYAGEDSPPWETLSAGIKRTNSSFPHLVTSASGKPDPIFYEALDATPFSNDLLLGFAEQVIQNENLGADDDTDLLTVSFSANDYVGHAFGPYSQEVMDISLNVDRDIGALLDYIDKRIGLQNTVVVLTADHGVAPIPEQAAAEGLGGGRIDNMDVLDAVKKAISAKFNPRKLSPDPTTSYFWSYSSNPGPRDAIANANLYFNGSALRRDGINEREIQEVACEAAMAVKGISRCFTRMQLVQNAVSESDPVARRVLHGFYPRRSGDIILVYDAFKYLGDTIPATHGSPYSYDTHVPMVIMGGGIIHGDYRVSATPADIAPTLASILRLQPPSNCVGRILLEAFPPGAENSQR